MSLEQIAAYFGGRDYSTVLHACAKVQQTLARDPAHSGTVRELYANLGMTYLCGKGVDDLCRSCQRMLFVWTSRATRQAEGYGMHTKSRRIIKGATGFPHAYPCQNSLKHHGMRHGTWHYER